MPNERIVFDHVHLISKDPHFTAAWYEEKLGGKIIHRSEVRGAPQIVIAFKGATIIVRGQREGEKIGQGAKPAWGTDHFGFRVEGDLDGFCEKLRQNGVRFTLDPLDFTPSIRIAFIEAPDGVSIELLQRRE